jgi:hypothetical protein
VACRTPLRLSVCDAGCCTAAARCRFQHSCAQSGLLINAFLPSCGAPATVGTYGGAYPRMVGGFIDPKAAPSRRHPFTIHQRATYLPLLACRTPSHHSSSAQAPAARVPAALPAGLNPLPIHLSCRPRLAYGRRTSYRPYREVSAALMRMLRRFVNAGATNCIDGGTDAAARPIAAA